MTGLLAQLAPDEIAEAATAYEHVVAEAYSWEVWGAACIALGGCSDDTFDYFLGWLVTRGRRRFERVTRDPDSLVGVVRPWAEPTCEEMLGSAWDAHVRVTGEPLPHTDPGPAAELGESWDFDDDAEMARRYPRLWRARRLLIVPRWGGA